MDLAVNGRADAMMNRQAPGREERPIGEDGKAPSAGDVTAVTAVVEVGRVAERPSSAFRAGTSQTGIWNLLRSFSEGAP